MLGCLVVLALTSPACASATGTSYAGLTRSQAVSKAESGVIALGLAIQGWTPAEAATIRHQLNTTPAKATHSTCNHKPAWRVLWPKSDPIYVNRGGLIMACSGH